jgi:hypothetical protein
MPDLDPLFHAFSAFCAGGAAASGWTASVIVANTSFDGLDHGRADRHLRQVLVASAGFQAALLGVAAGFAVMSGATSAFITAALAALGFLSNIWTLAPRRDKTPEGLKKRNSTRRIVAVALTLMMTAIAATAGGLAAFGV